MTLVALTWLIFQLNHLVDYKLHEEVSIDELHRHIENGDLFEWLGATFEGEIDLSLYREDPSATEIVDRLQRLLAAYAGAEDRKFGVKHNGICCLIGWTNELIQEREWRDAANDN